MSSSSTFHETRRRSKTRLEENALDEKKRHAPLEARSDLRRLLRGATARAMLPPLLALVAWFAVSGVAAEPSTRSLLGSSLLGAPRARQRVRRRHFQPQRQRRNPVRAPPAFRRARRVQQAAHRLRRRRGRRTPRGAARAVRGVPAGRRRLHNLRQSRRRRDVRRRSRCTPAACYPSGA